MWPEFVSDEREFRPETVADHEVYLSFHNDTDALTFRDWLSDLGWKQFDDYRKDVQR